MYVSMIKSPALDNCVKDTILENIHLLMNYKSYKNKILK